VNCKEEVLVRRGADDICCEEESDGENWCIPKEDCTEDLQSNDAQDEVLCQWLRATELEDLRLKSERGSWESSSFTHLWMGLYDGHSSCPVRLFGICPEEVVLLLRRLHLDRLGVHGHCSGRHCELDVRGWAMLS